MRSTDVPTAPADPRPVIDTDGVRGSRCRRCGYPAAPATPRCPSCAGPTESSGFPASGTVWAATIVHIATPGEPDVPYGLAYIDVDTGPRVLARFDAGAGLHADDRVDLVGSPDGAIVAVGTR